MTNRYGSITDVPGMLVGHAQHTGAGWLSGVSVVLPPPQTIGAVDVRGGGPGTMETDALTPGRLVEHVDAVVLTGGSAFGLASAAGVQRWCAEHGRGVAIRPGLRVPIVPAAVLFDLGRGGDDLAYPGPELGYHAAEAAHDATIATGTVGAGTGAQIANGTLKGGIGTASVRLPGEVVVGALVAVNAAGTPHDSSTGQLYGAPFVDDPELRPQPATERPLPPDDAESPVPFNTTLAVVATNARLDRPATERMALAGHDGLARALRPVHTLVDGDTVFGLATGATDSGEAVGDRLRGLIAVQAAAADAVTLAVVDAVLTATTVELAHRTWPAYLDHFPSARPTGF